MEAGHHQEELTMQRSFAHWRPRHIAIAILMTVLFVPAGHAQNSSLKMTPHDQLRLGATMGLPPSRLLISADLAVPEDEDHVDSVILPAKVMLPIISRLLARSSSGSAGLISTVSDGRKSHSITLRDHDAATGRFEYWEPWGNGSFLEAKHNAAGVDATPVSGKRKFFHIKSAELAQVLHSTTIGFSDMLWLNSILGLGTFGPLGDTLVSARGTEFFKWFHLEEAGVTPLSDGRRNIEHRPKGVRFHTLVQVILTTDRDNRILDVELILDRGFIDSPATSVFAADIAKSLLLVATAKRDRADIVPFVDNLVDDLKRGTVGIGPPETLPVRPLSPGYKAYKALQPTYRLDLTSSRLLVLGKDVSGVRKLSIRLTTLN